MSATVYSIFCARIKKAYNYLRERELLSAEYAMQTACNMTFKHSELSIYREITHDIDRAMMLGEYVSALRVTTEFMEKLGI